MDGEVVLTTHRILWGKPGDIPKGLICLSLHLYYVFCMEEESGGVFGLGGPKRIILHLGPSLPGILFLLVIVILLYHILDKKQFQVRGQDLLLLVNIIILSYHLKMA